MYGFTYRVACPVCRQLVDADERDEHICHGEFEAAFAAWLATPQGRFAAWDAARTRR
jgi:hypothetical protein